MRAIVGNGPLSADDRALIATADHIIRFNRTPNLSGDSNARTDELVLACSNNQIGKFLSRGHYRSDQAFQQAKRLVLPYHQIIIRRYMMRQLSLFERLKGRRSDWTDYCLEVANQQGKIAEVLSADLYYEACNILNIQVDSKNFFPSSGFMIILRALRDNYHRPDEIHIYGFGFTGWEGHPWEREKELVSAFDRQGRLSFHPVNQ